MCLWMPPYIAGLFRVITVALAGLSALPAAPAEAADVPPAAEGPAPVAEVIDGETLRLTDGRILRLAGIMVPTRAAGGDNRYAEAASRAVALLVGDRPVLFAFGARRMDRHGRFMAQVWQVSDDGSAGAWLQGALLADGFARVATTPDNLLMVPEMLRLEDETRRARRGLWGDPGYRVRTPEDAGEALDSFQVVEGRVLAVAIRRRIGYLNFGADYRTDFTLSLDAEALRLMWQANLDPMALQGIRVRARGWLRSFNGPLIEITHPEQIEVLQ
jgi:micrococcal nuclease